MRRANWHRRCVEILGFMNRIVTVLLGGAADPDHYASQGE